MHKIKIRPRQDRVEQVVAIGAAVPRDFKIWADANNWRAAGNPWEDRSLWGGSIDGALHVIRKLAETQNIFGVKSPVVRQEFSAYRRLKGKVPLRIASRNIGPHEPKVYSRIPRGAPFWRPMLRGAPYCPIPRAFILR